MKSRFNEADLNLFKKVKLRDREAFTLFFRRCYQKVFRFCYMYFFDYYKAENLTQETFVRFYKSVHRIRELEKFESFMFQIARRLCIDQFKKNGREILVSPVPTQNDSNKSIHDYVKPSEETPQSILMKKQDQNLVNEKIKELNPDQRAAIFLVHFEELTYEEASKMLGCPIGTVKTRVNRGILKLGKLIDKSMSNKN